MIDVIMNRIARIPLLIIVALVLVLAGCSGGPASSAAQVGERAPDFQLQNLDGQTISLGDLRGKPVLVNFWTTWCPPCRSEMPFLQQIYEEWSDTGLVLLAVDSGESQARVKEFLETRSLSLPVLLDTDNRVAQKYNIRGIPTTFFIDRDGIIQEKIVGAFPSKEAIEEHLGKIVR